MRRSRLVALALCSISSVAQGHYIFQQLTANGIMGDIYQNVRKNSNYNSPVVDLTSLDLRCNVGGAYGHSTSTVAIPTGSNVTMTADRAVYHQGPISFYMTAVSDAKAADGSTPWFKIKDIGPQFPAGKWNLSNNYTAEIPRCLPAGNYLLRIQQLAIHNPGSVPQFYIACAQLKVTGGGNGIPKPLVAIPGAFKMTDPGYTANIYNNFKNYTVPGPSVWKC